MSMPDLGSSSHSSHHSAILLLRESYITMDNMLYVLRDDLERARSDIVQAENNFNSKIRSSPRRTD